MRYFIKISLVLLLTLLMLFMGSCSAQNKLVQVDINPKATEQQISSLLKSIKVTESDSGLTLVIRYNDLMTKYLENLIIEYYEDYHELRFTNLDFRLQDDQILVVDGNVSDIAGSDFIKDWFKTPSNIDHSEIYSILFYNNIDFTVKFDEVNNSITIDIKETLSNGDLHSVRSPSMKLRELWVHLFDYYRPHTRYFSCELGRLLLVLYSELTFEVLKYI